MQTLVGPKFLDLFGHVLDQLGETTALGCRYPGEVDAAFIHADILQQVLEQGEFPTGHQVATNIVAVTGVSPGGQHTVSPVTQRADN